MSVKERYDEVVRNVFELGTDAAIDENMTRENTENWTSLLHLTLVSELEDAFGLMLETQDILELQSYAAGLEIVRKYVSEA